ncbi:MAG: glutamate 5-kinase, partial [Alteromonas sp.]|nr:glutamate 5-kinase [Alteromonas sp.]
AAAADADALIICSDIDGLYNKNPHEHDDAKMLKSVDTIDESIYAMAGGAVKGGVGTGGMRTKIEAAEKAVSHGIDTYIINGFTELSFNMLLAGENPGTHFRPFKKPMKENEHWMRHTSNAQGEVIIEGNFDGTLITDSDQLTSSEIIGVNGEFSVGDTILVRKEDGTKLVKAKSNYSSCLLNFIANQESDEFAHEFEEKTGPIISDQHVANLEKE